jgi:hypothetical protein
LIYTIKSTLKINEEQAKTAVKFLALLNDDSKSVYMVCAGPSPTKAGLFPTQSTVLDGRNPSQYDPSNDLVDGVLERNSSPVRTQTEVALFGQLN